MSGRNGSPLPFDYEAECAVIGSILLLPEVCDDIAHLKAEYFYDDATQKIYRCLMEMHGAGERIDVTLLVSRLRAAGLYEKIGGAAFLARLSGAVPNASHAIDYAGVVIDQAAYRDLDRIEARVRGDVDSQGLSTGFACLDEMTCGFHPGELILIAARPGMGKTAAAINIAHHVTVENKNPALFVSLEMQDVELVDRMLCGACRINGHRLRQGTISAVDQSRIVDTANQISQSPLFIHDPPQANVSEIASAARRIKRRDGLSLLIVDYLQLVAADNEKDPRHERVGKMSQRLKALARELQIPVLCLSQLNRQSADAKDHRPKLSHLRESGSQEQDADVVLLIHREEYYHHGDDRAQFAGQAELIVAKQRNGPVGDFELTWEADYCRFSDRAAERHHEFDDYAPTGGGF